MSPERSRRESRSSGDPVRDYIRTKIKQWMKKSIGDRYHTDYEKTFPHFQFETVGRTNVSTTVFKYDEITGGKERPLPKIFLNSSGKVSIEFANKLKG